MGWNWVHLVLPPLFCLLYQPRMIDDRWWMSSSRWNANWQENPKYSEKTCPNDTLPTINPTWPDPSSNLGRRAGKSAISYGTAIYFYLILVVYFLLIFTPKSHIHFSSLPLRLYVTCVAILKYSVPCLVCVLKHEWNVWDALQVQSNLISSGWHSWFVLGEIPCLNLC
jgi:hypothetical protein